MEDVFLQKFLRADLHGAVIKGDFNIVGQKSNCSFNCFIVLAAKCKSYEGVYGIVAKETQRTFDVVTPDNKILSK